jgi:hypothetical protein
MQSDEKGDNQSKITCSARSQSCKSRISIRVGAQAEQECKQNKSKTSEVAKLVQELNQSRRVDHRLFYYRKTYALICN